MNEVCTMDTWWHTRILSSQRVTGRLADWWADAVLYQRLISAHIQAQMQYRVSFLLMTSVRMVATGSDLLAILILFNYFGNWTAGGLVCGTPEYWKLRDEHDRVENLQKRFWIRQHHHGLGGAVRNLVTRAGREVRAVDSLSFRVATGEMIGYIGPNGAGKSTTIKMLTGILVPSGGQVTVAGLVRWRQRRALARRIGGICR
jgi:ABC-type glutathione transport system ATPase component